jgi:hypothetical protein
MHCLRVESRRSLEIHRPAVFLRFRLLTLGVGGRRTMLLTRTAWTSRFCGRVWSNASIETTLIYSNVEASDGTSRLGNSPNGPQAALQAKPGSSSPLLRSLSKAALTCSCPNGPKRCSRRRGSGIFRCWMGRFALNMSPLQPSRRWRLLSCEYWRQFLGKLSQPLRGGFDQCSDPERSGTNRLDLSFGHF